MRHDGEEVVLHLIELPQMLGRLTLGFEGLAQGQFLGPPFGRFLRSSTNFDITGGA